MNTERYKRSITRLRGLARRVFSAENLAGDVRSAMIGSGVGSTIGAVVALVASTFLSNVALNYTVFIGEDGYGQPKQLFDFAESQDPNLKLSFRPQELRSVYVCEYKHVTGPNWRQMVLAYLDAYRDCFDVTEQDKSSFVISPNLRTSIMERRENYYLCKCQASAR